MRTSWGRYVVGLGVAGSLVAITLPSTAGVAWHSLATAAMEVPPTWLLGLTGLWLLGLLSHTITLTAALPGLTHRRAFALSLTGSAVANVLPAGGAAGTALNVRMARAWGFSGPAISAYTVVTNVWDVLTKCVAASMLLVVVRVIAPYGTPAAGTTTMLAAFLVAAVGAGLLLLATSPSAMAAVGRGCDRLLGRWLAEPKWEALLVGVHKNVRGVVRDRWSRLSLGLVLYTLLLFALFAACLTVAGAGLGITALLAGFSAERMLTLAGITPGGAGIVEVGVTATLLAFPGSAVGVMLGVLMYRLLTFGLEIPVGGLMLGGWLWSRRRAGGLH